MATIPRRPPRAIDPAELQDQGGRRLAGLLHDGLAQSLTGVSLLAQAMATDLAGRPDARAESALAKALVSQIAGCVEQARALARLADPERVTGGSLASALQDLVLALPPRRLQPLSVRAEAPEHALGQRAAANVVRIALQVVLLVRESESEGEIELELACRGEDLVLTVSGRGAQQALASRDAAPQLWDLIEQRAHAIEATVAIERERGRPPRWILTMPCAGARKGK